MFSPPIFGFCALVLGLAILAEVLLYRRDRAQFRRDYAPLFSLVRWLLSLRPYLLARFTRKTHRHV